MPLSSFTLTSHQSLTSRLDHISSPTFSSLELLYTSHPRWPLPPSATGSTSTDPIHIAVLDSSFNPPTRAHLAIANSVFPEPHESCKKRDGEEPYTARLLLLSARNVDKTLKPGDATLAQRVEMMQLLAEEMERMSAESGVVPNVAVGAINHPTFVGKSHIILNTLRTTILPPLGTVPDIRLSFLIGTDTLTRLFLPKYYLATPTPSSSTSSSSSSPSPSAASTPEQNMHKELSLLFHQNRSLIVSAHRGTSPSARAEEQAFVDGTPECRRWVREGGIRFLEVAEEERGMSSTDVRRAVKREEGGELERLMCEGVREYVLDRGLYKD